MTRNSNWFERQMMASFWRGAIFGATFMLAAAMLAGCGETPNFVTPLGIEVYGYEHPAWTADAIDEEARVYLAEWPGIDLDGMNLHLWEGNFACGNVPLVAGCTNSSHRIQVAAMNCIARSAFIHELRHAHDNQEDKAPNYDH